MDAQPPARRIKDHPPLVRCGLLAMPAGATGAPDQAGPRPALGPFYPLDRLTHAAVATATHGISPASLALAGADWALHLAASPGKLLGLHDKAWRQQVCLTGYAMRAWPGGAAPCIEPLRQDRRFSAPAWQCWPYNVIHQGFLLQQQWWHHATSGVGGVSAHHENVVSFVARQWLDMFSPVNFVATNPEVQQAALRQGGQNFLRGMANLWQDLYREAARLPDPARLAFRPGHEVAATPGQVVYRNRLIELIQYAPQTAQVDAEPLLFIPAWIMKYYILDLSPGNSLVDYLVRRGHTVFMVSWHNPGPQDRELGMDDYLRLGIFAAVEAIRAIVPGRRINAAGYCLGGTLLAIAAAYDGEPFRSLTLLAAQTDFSEAGELTLFVDDSEIAMLENLMWRQGYLDTRQMAGAFQLLRSNDLIWSRLVRHYLLGKPEAMNDLMAWNADATRMPYRMHSEYLRRLFLNNDLFAGRYAAFGLPVALSDIHVPVFALGTETDHVAPWRSVYKFHLMAETPLTFVLTSGGHNAGIVSEPGHPGRHFRLSRLAADGRYIDPERWLRQTPAREGSWWPAWSDWLHGQATARTAPPPMGAAGYPPLCAAPGDYVLEQ